MNMRFDPFKLVMCLLLASGPLTKADAQLWKRLQDEVTNTAGDHVVNDAGNATDKAIDNTEDAAGKKAKGKKGKSDDTSKDSSSKEGTDTGSATKDGSSTTATPYTIKAYQNYDFVPGDTVLFYDDFADDMSGEFPAHWNLTKGQAVVNTIAGKPSFCLTDGNYCVVLPRMKKLSYLTDPFTIEFDTYTDGNGDESPLILLNYLDENGNASSGDITFARGDGGRGGVSTSGFPSNTFSASLPEVLETNYSNKWHHCAIIYKAGQLKCYVDQYRILVVPSLGCVPTSFGLEGGGDQDHPIVISNVRAAAGGSMNMVGKKFTDAKIVTHGINFDVGKATIEPQSMGTLNMIVKVLNDNPGLKFEIDGHTDNSGDAAHNLTLSQQRAASVETQLESMGISASRLSTKGYGDTKPLVSNDTPEGKANNRRVEFVRM